MKRIIFIVLLIIFNFFTTSYAQDDISDIIELYKAKKYQECITKSETITKNDPTSVLGYYYCALSYAQLGNKTEAIKNYDKVIALGTNKELVKYAKTGKSKLNVKPPKKQITGADSILDETVEEKPQNKNISDKIEQSPQKTTEKKEQPQISESKTQKTENNNTNKPPTNDEIVNAIRVLQRAGLLQGGLNALMNGNVGNQPYQQNQNNYMDSRTRELQEMLMMMNSGNNNNYNSGNDLMQMLPYMQNGGKMSPQMIQMMLMKNMTPDFSSGNNNY